MPMVSVLLPVHNASTTLGAALDSVLAQSLPDLEVVAVDDGSSDGTLALLQAYAQRDARVRLLPQARGGLIVALNAGLAACAGEYIARMDGDDICDAQRFELQVQALQQSGHLSLVSCRVQGFPPAEVRAGFQHYINWLNSLCISADIRREIFIESPLAHPSVTLRKSALQAMGGYAENGWPEDYDLWLRMDATGHQMAKLPQVLLHWRDHPARATRTDARYAVENFLRAKAHYLLAGPLHNRQCVIIWGAGQMGRRLTKHLQRGGAQLAAFLEVNPEKYGTQIRGALVLPASMLPQLHAAGQQQLILVAVAAVSPRAIIRSRLTGWNLQETVDYWCVA